MPALRISPQVVQAAHNNAHWCDTVCRAHGTPGEFHDYLWLNRHSVPRFYPNVVTLSALSGVADQLAAIRDLVATVPLVSFGVKDSFATLELAPLAFHILFEAHWLWRAASRPPPAPLGTGLSWTTVQQSDDLIRWEAAWNGVPAEDPSTLPPRTFLPALLADADIRFIAGYADQHIVAGAIANRTGDVVGVSNVFAPDADAAGCWAGCLATIIDAFPGLPLVGYERGNGLIIAQALGFEVVGPLRVWGNAEPSL
jgi:hypothetical protein